MAKHNFKEGQYYLRTWDPLVYKVCSCMSGQLAFDYGIKRDMCATCDLKLMLKISGAAAGYCCKQVEYSGSIRKLTKDEIILKDY